MPGTVRGVPDEGLPGEQRTRSQPSPPGSTALPAGAILALLALGIAVVQRGAYNPTTRSVVLVVAAASLVLSCLGRSRPAPRVLVALAVGSLLLIGSAALSASAAGDVGGAWEVAGLVLLFVAGVAGSAGTAVSVRPLIADALTLVGLVIGASAWVGVVWRVLPIGYPIGDLWRGGSTLTYANAAGAFLAMLLVVTVVRLATAERPQVGLALAGWVMGVGLVATVNRAGFIAVVVGLLVAAVAARPVRLGPVVLRLALPVAITGAGLATRIPDDGASPLGVAVVLAVAGGLVASVLERRRALGSRRVLLAIGALGVLVVGVATVVALQDDAGRLADARLSFASDDRRGAWEAAVDEVKDAPLLGAGPSTTDLLWTDGTTAWRIKYVHNEYLELLATQGLVGALAGLVAVGLLVRAVRVDALVEVPWLGPAVLGAVVAFAAHAAFDFDLHIPALVLAIGLISGLALDCALLSRDEDEGGPRRTEGDP